MKVPPVLFDQNLTHKKGRNMIRPKRLITLASLFTATLVWGQDQAAAPPPMLELEVSAGDVVLDFPTEDERASTMSRDAETISVEFPDEEVRVIISNVAELYDLNVVIPESLVGSTTIKLRNVTWRQVFEVVLEPLGYTYVEDRNIIKIKSNEELTLQPMDTRVFIIDFANAGDLKSSIAPLVDTGTGGRLQVDSRSNAFVITERPTRMNNIQEIIERLDRPTQQVMIESKFIEVTTRDSRNLGVNWSSLANYSITGGPFQRTYAKTVDQTRGSDSGNLNNTGTLNDTNSTSNDSTDFSSSSSGAGSPPSNSTSVNNNTANFSNSQTLADTTLTSAINLLNNATQGRIDTAVFSADAFGLVLSALDSLSGSELVSNPTVVTLNNTPAQINIGEEFPIPAYNYNDERGSFEVSGFDFRPIGIILRVTPHVNAAGFITLNINPEVSSRTGTVNFGGAGAAEIPIIATRRTQSTITIKDGFTLAIGGLVEKTVNNSSTKVPLLGDIPVIGKLFRSRNDTEDRRNLIIFITAKTLNPDGSTYKDVFSPEVLNSMGIKSSEIPGIPVGDNEQRLYDEIQMARDALDSLSRESKLRKQLESIQGYRDTGDFEEYESDAKKKKLDW
jgi:type IV pilus assembly protein PilQ